MLKNNIAKGVIRDLYEALDSIMNFLGIRITTTEKLSEEKTHLRRTKSVIIGTVRVKSLLRSAMTYKTKSLNLVGDLFEIAIEVCAKPKRQRTPVTKW